MVFRFTLKALYVTFIAFLWSLLYGLVMFGLFEGKFALEVEEMLLPASWGLVFGLLMILGEKKYRWDDANADIDFFGIPVGIYGYLVILGSLYVFGKFFMANGWGTELQQTLLAGVIGSIAFYLLHRFQKSRHSKK